MITGDEGVRWRRYSPGAESEQDVVDLRALLTGYAEPETSRHGNASTPAAFASMTDDRQSQLPTRLATLVTLFHECHFISEDDVPAETVDLLDRLGLIARIPGLPGLIYATAAILPIAGEWVVCDRGGAPDGSSYPLPPDVVYPPIFDNSRRYLAVLPCTPCEAMLEIGAGAGLAAMLGARHATHVWATDITARSVNFAKFSCQLANLANVTVIEGDMYSPVEGLTFDRIAIHPPWVPTSHSELIFGDGGEDGESIIRRSIEGLPRFLRPGGRFYTIFLASDRAGESFEQRVRRWLGPHEREFDIVLGEFSVDSAQGFLEQNVERGTIGQAEIPTWTALFNATATESMVYGQMIVQRQTTPRQPVTARTPASEGLSARQLESLLP